jgi:hypothetical protein
VTVGGRRLTAVGVVMGQGEGSDTSALLAAAGEAAEQLVGSGRRRRRVGGAGIDGRPPSARPPRVGRSPGTASP